MKATHMTDIISMEAGRLDVLAKRIRNSIDLRHQSDAEWVQATLDLAAALAEAKGYFNNNTKLFGQWLDQSGFDLGKDDRAAYVAFGSELERARGILENTKSRSVQRIYTKEFRLLSAKNSQKPKTAPRLNTTPEMQKALDAYDAFKAAGIEPTQEQVETKAGVSSTAVRRAFERRRTEAELANQAPDLSGFSATAKAKVEAAARQYQKQLDASFDVKFQQAIRQHMAEHVMPLYAEKLALADRILKVNQKPFSIEEYRRLLSALHPDSSSVERRTEMFLIVKQRELLLRPAEKDKPLSGDLPKTVEELLARRKKRR